MERSIKSKVIKLCDEEINKSKAIKLCDEEINKSRVMTIELLLLWSWLKT